MALTNPVNMFTEYNTLKGGGVPTTGSWKIVGAPSFPVELCKNCNSGGWSNATYNMNDVICASNDLIIDFSGVSCADTDAPYGEYTFRYVIDEPCPSEGDFKITIGPGSAEITFERLPDVCYIEAHSEHPDTPGDKKGKFTLAATNYIGTLVETRHKVIARDLDGCTYSPTTLLSTVGQWGRKTFSVGNGFNKTPDEAFTTTSYMDGLLYVIHRYRIALSGWGAGYYIKTLKLMSSISGAINVDCSSVILAGSSGGDYITFASSLKSYIGGVLEATPHFAGALDCVFNCDLYDDGVDDYLDIWFLCIHQSPNALWIGIDKNDFELEFSDGVNFFVTNNANNNANPWGVQFEQAVVDLMFMEFSHTVSNCDFYENSTNCDLYNHMKICETDYDGVYNLSNCNYIGLALASPTTAKIMDFDFACTDVPV